MSTIQTSARDLAHGKWTSILSQLGLDHHYLSGKHTDCPLCGAEKKWFRFDNKGGRGSFICTSCGSGDGFQLAERFLGVDFKTVAKRVEELAGAIKFTPVKVADNEKAGAAISRVWRESLPLEVGDPVWQYLTGRGLSLKVRPVSIRFHPGLEYRDDEVRLGKFPAMVAMVADAQGRAVTIHRTYLQDGKKAPVPQPKKLMTPRGPIAGGAIRLCSAAASDVFGIAEGIETALAAQQHFGIPVWSCISTSGIESFVPPVEADGKKLVIYADHDENFAGQKSAYALAFKLAVKKFDVEVRVPPSTGDWLDHLDGC